MNQQEATLRWAHNVHGRLVYDGPRGLWRVASEPAEPGAQMAIDLVAELNARVRELEAALRPFGKWANAHPDTWGGAAMPRIYMSDDEDEIKTHVTLGDLRRARAALGPTRRDA